MKKHLENTVSNDNNIYTNNVLVTNKVWVVHIGLFIQILVSLKDEEKMSSAQPHAETSFFKLKYFIMYENFHFVILKKLKEKKVFISRISKLDR